jgi:hypothetical protein
LSGADPALAESRAFGMDRTNDRVLRLRRQHKIDETGTGYRNSLDQRIRWQVLNEALSQLTRRATGHLRKQERRIRGEITVLSVASPLDGQLNRQV